MTAGEPHPALRAVVLDRIAGAEPRRSSRPAMWIAASAAAAAAIAVALIIGGRTQPPRVGRTTSPTPAATRERTPPPAVAPSQPHEPVSAAAIRPPRARDRSVLDAAGSAVESLAPPPLDVTRLPIAPIASGNSLRVRALDPPAPLELAPLFDTDTEKENRP
jgi:hypothetical protein